MFALSWSSSGPAPSSRRDGNSNHSHSTKHDNSEIPIAVTGSRIQVGYSASLRSTAHGLVALRRLFLVYQEISEACELNLHNPVWFSYYVVRIVPFNTYHHYSKNCDEWVPTVEVYIKIAFQRWKCCRLLMQAYALDR